MFGVEVFKLTRRDRCLEEVRGTGAKTLVLVVVASLALNVLRNMRH